MGREKVLEKATEEVINKSSGINNILMKYAPIILVLICLVVCYLLFKKLQSVSSQSDSVGKLEKQFTSFIKDQSEVNTVNSKRFNAMGSQMNQISYVMQNMSNRPVNEINTQLSPEREINGPRQVQAPQQVQVQAPQQAPQQVPQQTPQQVQVQAPQQLPSLMREPIPTSISNAIPIENNISMQPPQSTTNKKELDTSTVVIQERIEDKKSKKVVDIQTINEDVLIEEASSDEDE